MSDWTPGKEIQKAGETGQTYNMLRGETGPRKFTGAGQEKQDDYFEPLWRVTRTRGKENNPSLPDVLGVGGGDWFDIDYVVSNLKPIKNGWYDLKLPNNTVVKVYDTKSNGANRDIKEIDIWNDLLVDNGTAHMRYLD